MRVVPRSFVTEDIVHEATYPYPPDAVWRALTTPASMNAWFMETDYQGPTVGHTFQYRDKPKKVVGWNGITNCEVLEADASRRFVIRFGAREDGFPVTRLTWDLEATPEGGTRVRFRHSGFSGMKGWLMRQGMNQGWGAILRHAIPYVVAEAQAGRLPPRDEVKLVAKRGFRADHAASRAQP